MFSFPNVIKYQLRFSMLSEKANVSERTQRRHQSFENIFSIIELIGKLPKKYGCLTEFGQILGLLLAKVLVD